jgi:hypothetical protein
MPQRMHGIGHSANTFKEGIWNSALRAFIETVELAAYRPDPACLWALEWMAGSLVCDGTTLADGPVSTL